MPKRIDISRFCRQVVPDFAPLGGSRPDCAVIVCACLDICGEHTFLNYPLPWDVGEFAMTFLCAAAVASSFSKIPPATRTAWRIHAKNAREFDGISQGSRASLAKFSTTSARVADVVTVVDLSEAEDLVELDIPNFLNHFSLLQRVSLPTSLTDIAPGFACHSGVVTLNMSDNVRIEHIPMHFAFSCRNLRHVALPESVTSIDKKFLVNCQSLRRVDFSHCHSLTWIDGEFMLQCSHLEECALPDSLEVIRGCDFLRWTGILRLDLRGAIRLQGLGSAGFLSEAANLTELLLPESITSLGSQFLAGSRIKELDLSACCNLHSTQPGFMSACHALQRVVLPPSLVALGNECLAQTGLVSLDLSHCVDLEDIRDSFAADCKNIEVLLLPQSVTSLGDDSLSNCPKLTSCDMTHCTNLVTIGRRVLHRSQLKTVLFPESIVRIGESVLSCCGSLTKVDMSAIKQLDVFGSGCFARCFNLVEMQLPQCITFVPNKFMTSSKVQRLELRQCESLQRVGRDFLSSCNNVLSVELPSSTVTIEDDFMRDSSVEQVDLRDCTLLMGLRDNFLSHCKSLSLVMLPKSVQNLGRKFLAGNMIKMLRIEQYSSQHPAPVPAVKPRADSSNNSGMVPDEDEGDQSSVVLSSPMKAMEEEMDDAQIMTAESDIADEVSLVAVMLGIDPDMVEDGSSSLFNVAKIKCERPGLCRGWEVRMTVFPQECLKHPREYRHMTSFLGIGEKPFPWRILLTLPPSYPNAVPSQVDFMPITGTTNTEEQGADAGGVVDLPPAMVEWKDSVVKKIFGGATRDGREFSGSLSVALVGSPMIHFIVERVTSELHDLVANPKRYLPARPRAVPEPTPLPCFDGMISWREIETHSRKTVVRRQSRHVDPETADGEGTADCYVYIADGVESLGVGFLAGSATEDVDLSRTIIKSTGERCLSDCPQLRAIELPESLAVIGSHFLTQSLSMKAFDVEPCTAAIVEIGSHFMEGSGVITVDLRGCTAVTEIQEHFLANCRRLEEVHIPDSVKRIGSGFLQSCSSVNTVDLRPVTSLVELSDFFMTSCDHLHTIHLPDSVTALGSFAFSHCPHLVSLDFTNTRLESVGVSFADGCKRLRSLAIPPTLLSNPCAASSTTIKVSSVHSLSKASLSQEEKLKCLLMDAKTNQKK